MTNYSVTGNPSYFNQDVTFAGNITVGQNIFGNVIGSFKGSIFGNTTINGNVRANQYVVSAGSSNQFLKADGSLDSNLYLTNGNSDNIPNTIVQRNGLGGFSAGIVTASSFVKSGGTSSQYLMADGTTTTTFFATGTTLLFYQAAAPTGWTQVTTHDNKALRVVSGTGGGSGGSTNFTTVFASTRLVPLVDHNHTPNDPGHSHGTNGFTLIDNTYGFGFAFNQSDFNTGYRPSGGTTAATTGITINNASATQTTGNTMNFAVQYIDIILCSKN